LAQAIETLFNNARNRFTSIDVHATFCRCCMPLIAIYGWSLHLGSVVNKALGRRGQTQFEPCPIEPKDTSSIPGRTVILKQNKWDMGAHQHFTLLDRWRN